MKVFVELGAACEEVEIISSQAVCIVDTAEHVPVIRQPGATTDTPARVGQRNRRVEIRREIGEQRPGVHHAEDVLVVVRVVATDDEPSLAVSE